MDGPQYHASSARGPQDVLRLGGLNMTARVPGGAMGCAFQQDTQVVAF